LLVLLLFNDSGQKCFLRIEQLWVVQGSIMIPIFENFRRKIGVFLKNQCYDQIFALFSLILSKKAIFFANFFSQKYF
jgi:hypothetical protein